MKAKLYAFLFHLGCSAVVALAVLGIVYFVWYPGALSIAAGVSGVLLTIIAVDVAIGPMLTAVVYNSDKKSLKFDLSVIVLLQLGALCYGAWALADGRPAWLVFNVDRFDMVRVLDVDTRKLSDAKPEYRNVPWLGPRWVSARVPESVEARQEILFESVAGGMDVPQKPELYAPLHDEAASIRERARSLAELKQFNSAKIVDEELSRWPSADAWVPMMSNAKPVTVLLNRKSAEVVAIVNLAPWGSR